MTPFEVAQRFVGVNEAPGTASNPLVLAMLRLDEQWPTGDEVAWCSAFVNFVAWLWRLPRSRKLSARSWLGIGESVPITDAKAGWDVVILKRGDGEQPGPEVLDAPGHVGFYAGRTGEYVNVLGGNQGDAVTIAAFPVSRVLGIRRLGGPK
jgi:uncharacterized protein (TIGR02594 family)